MDGLKDIADLISQYDWREVISLGMGTAAGSGHAIYDIFRGNEKEPSTPLAILSAALAGAYNPVPPWDSFSRNLVNGLLGGLAYVFSYELVYNKLYQSRRVNEFLNKLCGDR